MDGVILAKRSAGRVTLRMTCDAPRAAGIGKRPLRVSHTPMPTGMASLSKGLTESQMRALIEGMDELRKRGDGRGDGRRGESEQAKQVEEEEEEEGEEQQQRVSSSSPETLLPTRAQSHSGSSSHVDLHPLDPSRSSTTPHPAGDESIERERSTHLILASKATRHGVYGL